MKRPNKQDYVTTDQFSYNEKLNEYYKELEKYADYCEQQLALRNFNDSYCAYCGCKLHETYAIQRDKRICLDCAIA